MLEKILKFKPPRKILCSINFDIFDNDCYGLTYYKELSRVNLQKMQIQKVKFILSFLKCHNIHDKESKNS